MRIVNTEILKHPLNWAIVWLMLLIAAFGGHWVLRAMHVENPHDKKTNNQN